MTNFVLVPHPYYPEHIQLSPWALCQAKWVWDADSPVYRDTFVEYSRAGGNVILDWQHPMAGNATVTAGTPQLRESDLDSYFGLIGRLRPHTVVIPDVLRDGDKTLGWARSFLKQWNGYGRKIAECEPDFMFVPQGKDETDFLSCVTRLAKDTALMADIGVIGIPKWLESVMSPLSAFGPARWDVLPRVISRLEEHYNHADTLRYHLLGVWNGLNEMRQVPEVFTWDSSLPVAAAQHAVDYSAHTRNHDVLDVKHELVLGPARLNFRPTTAKAALHGSAWGMVANNVRMAQYSLRLGVTEELQ